MPTFALLLAYDGTDFAGWWRQPGLRTVAGELDAAFSRLGDTQAQALGASRTDAGVHARGQVAHVATMRDWTAGELHAALAHHLPPDLCCTAIASVPDDWHACHQALGKTYSYRIDNGVVADPFQARYAWRTPFRCDLNDLRAVACAIPARRDWRGFARRGEMRDADSGLVRQMTDVSWDTEGSSLVCRVTGDGFIYRLVRSLVGAMVAVAHGTCSADDLAAALAGDDSPAGRQQAPACGLCLEQVAYAVPPSWSPRAPA
jgi:tRNA pseudouridine38-40 synthase